MHCEVEGCTRQAERPGRCATHRKRAQRHGDLHAPIRPYGLSPLERLAKAALAYANAEADLDFRRARDLLRKHATAMANRLRKMSPLP